MCVWAPASSPAPPDSATGCRWRAATEAASFTCSQVRRHRLTACYLCSHGKANCCIGEPAGALHQLSRGDCLHRRRAAEHSAVRQHSLSGPCGIPSRRTSTRPWGSCWLMRRTRSPAKGVARPGLLLPPAVGASQRADGGAMPGMLLHKGDCFLHDLHGEGVALDPIQASGTWPSRL